MRKFILSLILLTSLAHTGCLGLGACLEKVICSALEEKAKIVSQALGKAITAKANKKLEVERKEKNFNDKKQVVENEQVVKKGGIEGQIEIENLEKAMYLGILIPSSEENRTEAENEFKKAGEEWEEAKEELKKAEDLENTLQRELEELLKHKKRQ